MGLAQSPAPPPFTVEQVLSLPTPDNLMASPVGSTIAWTFNERGVRNIYIADGPDFVPRRLTDNTKDDGQELTNLSFAKDGKTIIYVRGGDHGATRPGDAPNPAASPTAPKMQVWAVATTGGPAKLLGDGDSPAVSPDGTRVAFTQDRKIFLAPIDGSKKAEAAFALRGTSGSPAWSPDGKTLAFVSNRGDHSFIALWTLGSDVDPLHQPADEARQRAGLVDGRQEDRLRPSARHRWRAAESARGARVVVVDPRRRRIRRQHGRRAGLSGRRSGEQRRSDRSDCPRTPSA